MPRDARGATIAGMEWVGLVLWALTVGLAVPLAIDGALTAGALGAQALLVLAGLGFCLVYLALGHPRWPAWTSFGLALLAAAVLTDGTRRLLSDEPRSATAGQLAEDHAGTLAGIELPVLLTVASAMALAAAGVTTID
jgi:hypothetical protein